jgi:hypothetical protein
MEAQGSFYSPAEDPECTLCCDSDDRHTIFAIIHFKDWTKTFAPYSVVTYKHDLLEDISESPADLGERAYVWHTFDSPYVPIGKMNSRLPQSRAPASTVAAGMAKKGPRPVIIFPNIRPGDKQGCLMATFDGGKIKLDQSFTDFFASGVWPTLANGSNGPGCVTHIHTTPTWDKAPAFSLAAVYDVRTTGDHWTQNGRWSYLSAKATRVLEELCEKLDEEWSTSKEWRRRERTKVRTVHFCQSYDC